MKFQKELERFQYLLEELFQFEASDLDFGIYRILNYKREQIKDFIENRLPEIVESAFEKHKQAFSKNIDEEFNKVKEDVKKILGDEAISPTGELNEIFKNTPLGKKYLDIKEQKELLEKIEEIKGQVYNDLYSFFSRFYEDGDFIPQYRYTIKGYKYAIPYNGEEVKLHWATADQYYIKTGLLFRDYTFKTGGIKVVFRVVEAEEELGSNKATKERFFVLDDENHIEINESELVIRFQYRELIDDEVRRYEFGERESISSKQEKINFKIFATIEEFLKNNKQLEFIKYLIEERKNEKPLLLYHINRFTAKNTRDYFIHKNLKKFLSEQLDYFIKSEVLNYETLSEEKYLDKHITRAKTVKEIGEKIIEFLAQIEDFQKRLWEKKKFVIKTEYVITLDRIKSWTDEEFYKKVVKKVLNNSEQLKEWEALGFGKIETEEDLEDKKLPIDTRYFDEDFKYELLEKISENVDIEDALDGLLIKSENWQALNTILNKYREKVQTIYIDPPFNKEQDADYLYRVKYKDATWITMLENRLKLAKELLDERGSIFVRCDYNGNMYVRLLINEIFGEENFRNEITIAKSKEFFKTMTHIAKFSEETESLFFFSKSNKLKFNLIYKEKEKPSKYEPFLPVSDKAYRDFRIINGEKYYSPLGRKWGIKQEDIDKFLSEGRLKYENGKWYLYTFEEPLKDVWIDYQGYSRNWGFKTENSEIFPKRVIESTSNEGDLIMDFFLGSGTTTAVAHKLKRKWIGIEMGEHFWTIIIPRMKKVLAYDESGISKEKDVKEKYNEKTAGGFFKYQYLEQYEDALDNIELKENKSALELFKDDYLLKYFLEFETRESPYLLNIEYLKNPFAYKLKVNLSAVGEPKEMIVDIPETFNYLLGLKVKKIKRKTDNEKTYLFVLGEKEGRDYAIVWREYSDQWKEEDFKKDKEFIKQELQEWKPQVVYVNGQSILTPNFGDFQVELHYIEPEFKRLMEG